LSGDINREGGKHLYQDEELRNRMDAHVLKALHHGSHEFYHPLLAAINPQIYAARRVAAAYMWEYYGTHPKVRSIRQ
jgi:beta-lactamase superfamily II metal-dependent hydrolase